MVSPTTGRAASDASGAVFKSSDGGASWVPANSGLNHTAVLTLAIDPKNPRTLYAGTVPGGIFKSVDGAATWTRINFTAASTDIAAVVVDPVNSGTVYTVARNDITRLACAPIPSPIQGTDSGIYKTMDGGTTWIAVNWGGPPGGKVNAIAIDPSYSGNVYAGLSGGVFKSTNGGANWTPVSSGLTNNNIRALAVDPAKPTTIYAGTSGGVFKSIDSGANWSVENNGLPGVRLNCTATPAAPTGVSVFCRTWQAGLTFASRARAKTQ